MKLQYRIVIPSRKRVEKARAVLRLVPTAVVYVDEREYDDYARVLGQAKVVAHAPTENCPAVRNCMQDDFEEPCLVQIDDDLKGVERLTIPARGASKARRRLVGPPQIRHSDTILQIIENGVRVAMDLDVGMYGWNRSGLPLYYFPGEPFLLVAPICNSFLIRGRARWRRFDEDLSGRAALDVVLRALKEDRIVLQDRRFYFNQGSVYSGAGGNVDLLSGEQFAFATREIAKRWPGYITDRPKSASSLPGGGPGGRITKAGRGMTIRVQRKSNAVEMR